MNRRKSIAVGITSAVAALSAAIGRGREPHAPSMPCMIPPEALDLEKKKADRDAAMKRLMDLNAELSEEGRAAIAADMVKSRSGYLQIDSAILRSTKQ